MPEGGKLADASLASYKTGLSALHTHVAAQRQRQQEQLTALAAQLADSLSSALTTIEGLLPSHKQDMALVELLAANVEGVRRKVAAALHSNCEAAERLDGMLQRLQESISSGGASAAEQPSGDALGECQRLLACMDQLRLQLLRQGQVSCGETAWHGETAWCGTASASTSLQPMPACVHAAAGAAAAAAFVCPVRPGHQPQHHKRALAVNVARHCQQRQQQQQHCRRASACNGTTTAARGHAQGC
jgi:hypothetical protein